MQEFVRRHKRRIWKHKDSYGKRRSKWNWENQRQDRRSSKTNIGIRGYFASACNWRRTDKYCTDWTWTIVRHSLLRCSDQIQAKKKQLAWWENCVNNLKKQF